MNVIVLGIRGIPNVQGGVETHAEEVYRRLAARGCDIEVLVRTPFVPAGHRRFGAVRLQRIWSPRQAGLEALIHSFLGVLYAAAKQPDVLHIHAIGPAIVTPLARAFGLRVVVTHHGPDYDRDKWGRFARWVLRTGERFGMRWSDARIVISKVIAELVRAKHGVDSDWIPNGVAPASIRSETDYLQQQGLQPGRYFLQVSRMVPEKRQLDLIRAFAIARPAGWKLVLTGGLTQDTYCKSVMAAAKEIKGVVLTGFLRGPPLAQLYSHCGAFILPSSHEGLPIALLEALSYGTPVLASDIPANKEIGLEQSSYFPLGQVDALAERLTELAAAPPDEAARAARRQWVAKTYDWDRVCEHTLGIYRRVTKAP